MIIRGDSMLPTYRTGDLVVLHVAAAYRAGEVLAYRVPVGEIGEGRIVIHRAVSGTANQGFTMLGDNNKAPDPWIPRSADLVGTPWLVIGSLGDVLILLRQPFFLASLMAAAVVAWISTQPIGAGRLRRRNRADRRLRLSAPGACPTGR